MVKYLYDEIWVHGRHHLKILLGSENGPDEQFNYVVGYFIEGPNENINITFDSIGDINNDGFDDLSILSNFNDLGRDIRFFYGSTYLDSIPDFEIEYDPETINSFNCGDYNGDGITDFIGYNGGPSFNEYVIKLWYGTSEEFSSEPDIYLEAGNTFKTPLAFGDFNNDGYEDFIMRMTAYNLFDGCIYIYLGGDRDSPSYDLFITPRGQDLNWANGKFGSSATVGDYNNDGYDDFAVGAPDQQGRCVRPPYRNGQGKVIVFAGNGDLAEIDPVANSGE